MPRRITGNSGAARRSIACCCDTICPAHLCTEHVYCGAWCKGSTPDFGSVDLGSNPGAPAMNRHPLMREFFSKQTLQPAGAVPPRVLFMAASRLGRSQTEKTGR